MCYTIQTSITSLLVGLAGCITLITLSKKVKEDQMQYKRELFILGIFFIFVSLMQLYDSIFWKTQALRNEKERCTNSITTKIAIITNHLQPVILACLFYFIYKNSTSLTQPLLGKWSKLLILLYSIAIIPYTIQCFITPETQTTTVSKKSSPSLYWAWNHQPGGGIVYALYLLSLLILFAENIKTKWIKWLAVGITLFSFIFTYFKHERAFFTGGRFWCYFGSFLVWTFCIGYVIFKRDLKK